MYTHVHLMSADVLMFTDVVVYHQIPFNLVHLCTLINYIHALSCTLTFTGVDITVSLYFIVSITRLFYVHFVHWCTDKVLWNCGFKSCHMAKK